MGGYRGGKAGDGKVAGMSGARCDAFPGSAEAKKNLSYGDERIETDWGVGEGGLRTDYGDSIAERATYRSMVIRPAGSPPMVISKNTCSRFERRIIGHGGGWKMEEGGGRREEQGGAGWRMVENH